MSNAIVTGPPAQPFVEQAKEFEFALVNNKTLTLIKHIIDILHATALCEGKYTKDMQEGEKMLYNLLFRCEAGLTQLRSSDCHMDLALAHCHLGRFF